MRTLRCSPTDAELMYCARTGVGLANSKRSARLTLGRASIACCVIVASLALSACGGSDAANDAGIIAATEATCGDMRVNESSELAYLVLPRGCVKADELSLRIVFQTKPGSTTTTFIVKPMGAAFRVELAPGKWRTVSVHRAGSWRVFANNTAWDWRDGAGLLAKDGGLYLLGGWNSDTGTKNDVWFSDDVMSWIRLVEHAPWPPRHGAGWVVHRNRLFVVGGDLNADVWSSSNGIDWTLELADAPFGKRYTPMAYSTGNELVLFGGQAWEPFDWCAFRPECTAKGFNDSWSSADGQRWAARSTVAPWAGRGLVHNVAVYDGRAFLFGGGLKIGHVGATLAETLVTYDDIWSTVDGREWKKEADTLEFSPRTHHTVLGTSHGCYVAGGSVGRQANLTNEVWFAPDCIHFAAVAGTDGIGVRHAASLAEFNGSIVLLGGHRDTAGTSIWQYFPDLP